MRRTIGRRENDRGDPLSAPARDDVTVRLLVLGMPCAGKSTVARLLRDRGVNVIDVDDEILRLNGGQWPETIEIKENVLQPKMLDAVLEMPSVVLLNSYMQVER